MFRNRRRRRSAFTLLEMLIVVAIISLLASLIVPSIGVMLARAKRGGCAQNLRGIFQGMILYENENEKQPRWMQHNGAHYGTSHLNFYGLREDRNYASTLNQPNVGYSGLGKLIGSNDPMSLIRQTTNFGSLPSIKPHYKYCKGPQVFFCPAQTDKGLDDTWWKPRWDRFPYGRNYHTNQISYGMRPGTSPQYGIPGDFGFTRYTSNWWRVDRQFSIQYPKNVMFSLERYAVAADAAGCKSFVHTGHGDGGNAAYNNGAVFWRNDDNELLSTYNNTSFWSYGVEYATRQVNIWKAYDGRFNP